MWSEGSVGEFLQGFDGAQLAQPAINICVVRGEKFGTYFKQQTILSSIEQPVFIPKTDSKNKTIEFNIRRFWKKRVIVNH